MYWIRVRRYGLSFDQKLPLGWVIIGDACLGKAHKPEVGGVCKTSVLSNGRNSLLVNAFSVKECSCDIFKRLACDEKPDYLMDIRNFFTLWNLTSIDPLMDSSRRHFHFVMINNLY